MRIIGFFILITLGSCNASDKEEIRLLFTGDILLSRNVEKEILQKKVNPWFNFFSEFKSADLVVGNLEGAVGTKSNIADTAKMVFDISRGKITLLKEAGFSVITVENNHSNDLGPYNKDTTLFELKNAKIIPVSKDNSPWFIKVKNRTISFIAVNLVKDRFDLQDSVPSIPIQQKLRLARNLSDFVIVSIHWGNELLDWPSKTQRMPAEWLIDNGADLIIGHHPHVIQDPEIIKGKPVFFSLGNHLFDQKYVDSKKGLIVECIIKNGKANYNGIMTKTIKNSFFPEVDKRISFGFKKIRINSAPKFHNYTIKPTSILQGTKAKVILSGTSNKKKTWTSQPISLLTIEEAEFDNQNKYLFTLEQHFSTLDKEIAPRPYVYRITDTGLQALWRGSGLSRPLIDATLTLDNKYLIALHRTDPFISLDYANGNSIIEIYQWNGFGFSGLKDRSVLNYASRYYKSHQNK
jgi:poly-gamma-glutamate synthesis protein (capsule biosynthesis protein)